MRKIIFLIFVLVFVAFADNDNFDEPDLNSIFGTENLEADDDDSDSPDIGSIFGDEESSNEPDLSEIIDEKPDELNENFEQLWYVVPMDPLPTNFFRKLYYYLDLGPKYIQHYLTKGPNTFLEYIEAETGIPFQAKKYPLEISGFVEGRSGIRTQHDKNEKFASIGELRAQIEAHKTFEWKLFDNVKFINWKTTSFNFKGDVYGDFVTTSAGFDLREANVEFSPFNFADVKIGRQILTWGTGDMLFINDLFPKDWKSYFAGRDIEYLKAPSDALKVSVFNKIVNIDAVWVPLFNPDRFITGERISYWNPMLRRLAGRKNQISTDIPNGWFSDSEWHLRAYRNINLFDKSYQIAAYYYNGFWKSPAGFNPKNGNATFPRLNVYGTSIRGPIWKGIANTEFGFYDSYDDRNGGNPFVENSQLRWLAGYELNMEPFFGRTIGKELTLAAQYYAEFMLDYSDYKNQLPSGTDPKNKYRQVVTLRATKMLLDQDLELSLFGYFSPTDLDTFIRPHISYKITDYWNLDVGANVFVGKKSDTFFGQFSKNSSVYIGLRFSF